MQHLRRLNWRVGSIGRDGANRIYQPATNTIPISVVDNNEEFALISNTHMRRSHGGRQFSGRCDIKCLCVRWRCHCRSEEEDQEACKTLVSCNNGVGQHSGSHLHPCGILGSNNRPGAEKKGNLHCPSIQQTGDNKGRSSRKTQASTSCIRG